MGTTRIPSDRPPCYQSFGIRCKLQVCTTRRRRPALMFSKTGPICRISHPFTGWQATGTVQKFALQSFAHTLSLAGQNCKKELNAWLEQPSFESRMLSGENSAKRKRIEFEASSMRIRCIFASQLRQRGTLKPCFYINKISHDIKKQTYLLSNSRDFNWCGCVSNFSPFG